MLTMDEMIMCRAQGVTSGYVASHKITLQFFLIMLLHICWMCKKVTAYYLTPLCLQLVMLPPTGLKKLINAC